MYAASATLESTRDSTKYIIAQLVCPVQRSLMQRFQLSPSLAINPGSERECRITSGSPVIQEFPRSLPTSLAYRYRSDVDE